MKSNTRITYTVLLTASCVPWGCKLHYVCIQAGRSSYKANNIVLFYVKRTWPSSDNAQCYFVLQFVVVGKEEQHSEEVVESVWEKLVERKSISLIVSILCDVRFISANEGQLQRIASNLVDAAAGKRTSILPTPSRFIYFMAILCDCPSVYRPSVI